MKYFHTLWAKASLLIRWHFRLLLRLVLLLWLAVLSTSWTTGPHWFFFPSLISPSLAFIHLTPDNRLSIVWGRNRYVAHSIMDKLAYQNLFQFKGQGRVGAEPHSYWNLVTVPAVTHNNPCPSLQERGSYLRTASEVFPTLLGIKRGQRSWSGHRYILSPFSLVGTASNWFFSSDENWVLWVALARPFTLFIMPDILHSTKGDPGTSPECLRGPSFARVSPSLHCTPAHCSANHWPIWPALVSPDSPSTRNGSS